MHFDGADGADGCDRDANSSWLLLLWLNEK